MGRARRQVERDRKLKRLGDIGKLLDGTGKQGIEHLTVDGTLHENSRDFDV